MKRKLIISAIVWLTIAAFYLTKSNEKANTETVSNTGSNSIPFLIGSPDNGAYKDFFGYSKASMNLWITYSQYDRVGGRVKPIGWVHLGATNDLLLNEIGEYAGQVQSILDTNANHGMFSYMMRPKIEYLCYGQKSDYQCEPMDRDYTNLTDWFYSYDSSKTGEPIKDNQSTKVMFCGMDNPNHSAGYVVKNLKTNRELCSRVITNLTQDNVFEWYILPKIKIPQNTNDNARVCRIEIVNWGDTIIKTYEILASHFKFHNSYSGNYIDEFNRSGNGYEPLKLSLSESQLINSGGFGWTDLSKYCHFDIRVYWYKECNMWIDYVRVENDIAYDLYKGIYDNWIQQEAQQIGGYASGKPYKFYIEEVEYNHLPCIKYVNDIIKQSQSNMSVVCVPYLCVPPINSGWINFEYDKIRQVYQNTGLTEFYMSYYPLHGNYYSERIYNTPSNIPNTFQNCDYDLPKGKLGVSASPNVYEANLQQLFEHPSGLFIKNGLQTANQISKDLDIPFIFLEQAHLWLNSSTIDNEGYSQREPTNEELEVMGCIAITYGAKGISYFMYDSWGDFDTSHYGYYWYGRGLTEYTGIPRDTAKRYSNIYGQNKWGKIVEVNKKYTKWGPHIMDFDYENTNSYIFHNETERTNLYSNTFFKNIRVSTGGSTPECNESLTSGGYDNPNTTYLQAATFKKPGNPFDKYFMIVNRRCSPVIPGQSCDGKRIIEIAFDSIGAHCFEIFNNWKIIDLEKDSTIITFDKRLSTPISLGWYQPGEGKLYKIAPVMQEGGDFVCDEDASNFSIVCKGTVNTNGFDLNLTNGNIDFKSGVTINANQSDIEINGGTFKGFQNEKWNGFYINESPDCYIGGITISNISNFVAFDIINSPACTFHMNYFQLTDNNSSPVNAVRVNNTGLNASEELPYFVFWFNNVQFYNSTYGLSVVYSSESMGGSDIQNNTFNSIGNTENIGIVLSGSCNSFIDSNRITNFSKGVLLLNSSVSFGRTEITSSINSAYSIFAASGSLINMTPYLYGGYNSLNESGSEVSDIYVSNSDLQLDSGYNKFNVSNENSNYHLNGYLPIRENEGPDSTIYQRYNCFRIDANNIDLRYNIKREGTENLVAMCFSPNYDCSNTQNLDNIVDFIVPLGNDLYDTVYVSSMNSPSPMQSINKNVYRNMRKRDYQNTKTGCLDLLNNYLDSIKISDIISKLYLCTIKTDTSASNIQNLKTFLEQKILNHPNNVRLVKSAFYQIQKCKVYLEQYTSALAGFEEIITQNPYSYEGLVASWDYAATILQMDTSHISGGFKDDNLFSLENSAYKDSLRMQKMLNTDNYDIKSFTKENRKAIFTNARDVFTNEKEKQNEIVKKLEEKSKGGDLKASAELVKMKTLKEVVKTNRPKTTTEYINIINDNINKVFKSNSSKGIKTTVNIPTTFQLYQNCPNPFNPTTKISFDLPKDLKVTIIIYDILGREVTKIINNEFRTAGKYVTEFNASTLSSGIYFYQIRAGEFIQARKMLLVK